MELIVFVCTGNTCRSPMAEGFFRALRGEEKTGLIAMSAGLYTTEGLLASGNAQQAAAERGADISGHRSRILTPELVQQAKYIVCMTGAHYERVREAFPAAEDKLFTLTEHDVSDPFGGDIDVYRRTADEIKIGVESIIERLEKPQ